MTAYMDHKNLANEVIDDVRAVQIADGVHRVLDRIASAEQHAGRDAGSVRLLAATKTRDVGEIMAAIDAGVRMIGENRPQEVTAKAEGLMARCAERGFALGVAGDSGIAFASDDSEVACERIPFHLIGQLQSNKIGKVLPVVNAIESVDSLDLAEKSHVGRWRAASPWACCWKSTNRARHRNPVAIRRMPFASRRKSAHWTGLNCRG